MLKGEIRTYSRNPALIETRRREIIKSSTRVFVEKGYDRTTMRDLAAALGLSTGAMYHYIGSKEDILHLIIEFTLSGTQQYLEELSGKAEHLSATEALTEAIRAHLHFVDEYQDMVLFNDQVMVNMDKSHRRVMFEAANRMYIFFRDILIRGIESGEFKIRDPELCAFLIVGHDRHWATRRWFLRRRYTLEEYVRETTEFILNAIGPRGVWSTDPCSGGPGTVSLD